MRALISKVLTGSMIAGAALAVSACGPKTETTTDNTMVTDMNADSGMGDTMTDNMTATDGAMADNSMMANDTTMMSNDTMGGNSTTMTTNTTTTTTNAM